jgi:hypothetical protein
MGGLRSIALGVCCALFLASASLAGPAAPTGLEAAFDNTIRITSKNGEEFIYFNRDGTFTSSGPAGDEFGTWKVDGSKICTKTKDAAESCGVIELNRAVGDKWEHKLGDETVTIEIIKGR